MKARLFLLTTLLITLTLQGCSLTDSSSPKDSPAPAAPNNSPNIALAKKVTHTFTKHLDKISDGSYHMQLDEATVDNEAIATTIYLDADLNEYLADPNAKQELKNTFNIYFASKICSIDEIVTLFRELNTNSYIKLAVVDANNSLITHLKFIPTSCSKTKE